MHSHASYSPNVETGRLLVVEDSGAWGRLVAWSTVAELWLGQSWAKVKQGQGCVFGAELKIPDLFTAHLTFLPLF